MRFELPKINHSKESFEILASIYNQTEDLFFDDVVIDMERTKWFDADMCAVLGAILHSLTKRLNSVNLINLFPNVEKILSKNGFLSHYGGEKIPDHWGTTIPYQVVDIILPYQRFNGKDVNNFVRNIENDFMHRPELPQMSPLLFKRFSKSIGEIFGNAVRHSQSKLGVFSCGQYFPTKNLLCFTVVDLGMGIRENIRVHTNYDLTPVNAITWATKQYNTSKPPGSSDMPSGLGLPLLCDFIDVNDGCIRIVSDAGYWQRKNKEITTRKLSNAFPGTVVSLQINTADDNFYGLSSELNPKNIL